MSRYRTASHARGDRACAALPGPSGYRVLVIGSLIAWLAFWAFPVNGQTGDAPRGGGGEGRFRLRSGDRFVGRIESLRAGATTLEVRHPLVTEVMSIETAALAHFEAADRPGGRLAAHWQIDLVNGDRLVGKVGGLSADGLDLETETVGRITIPRAWLRAMTRMGGAAPVLDGPGDPSDWKTFNMESLQMAAGGGFSLPQQGAISRAISEMPDIFRLDMELRYTGRPNWLLRFYASDSGVQNVTGYLLHRSDSAFRLSIQSPAAEEGGRRSSRSVARANVEAVVAGPTTELLSDAVTIMVDRPRQSMRIFLNGAPVCTWTEIAPLEAFGNILTLHTQWGMVGTELRDIRLVPLSGLPPDTAGWEAPEDVDVVWLGTDNRITGTIETLEEGTWHMREASDGSDISGEKALHIAFAAPQEPVAREPGEAVVALRDGSRITLGITSIEDGMLTGQSTVTGMLRVRLADMRWIDWAGDDVEVEAPVAGRLDLSNGDRLNGIIERWYPDKRHLKFRHPRIRYPLTIALSGLREYRAFPPTDGATPAWQVDLGFGEERLAPVDLLLDDAQLTVQTRYMGTLQVPRGALSVLSHWTQDAVLLRGIDRAGWQSDDSGPAPTFPADGSGVLLPPNGMISRALPALPDAFRIEIEMQSQTKGAGVQLLFGASDRGMANVSAYMLSLWPRNPRLQLNGALDVRGQPEAGGFQMLPIAPVMSVRGQLWTRSTAGGATHRYTVLMDRSKRNLLVYLDGDLVAEAEGVMPLAEPGRFFTIRNGQQFPVLITDVLVSEWDGRLPGSETRDTGTDMDTLYLRNRDSAPVRVLSIDSDVARVATARMTLDIPIARLSSLRLAGTGKRPTGHEADTQLTLTDGSVLLLASSGMTLDGGTMTGESPHLGAVRFPLEAVRSIRWHAYGNAFGTNPTLLIARGMPNPRSTVDPPPVTIPYIEMLTVDAGMDVWQAVPAHRIPEKIERAPDDRPEFRVAWNHAGLYLRFVIQDRNLREADTVQELFTGSGVEIYMAPQRGSQQMIQTIIAPGLDRTQNELRTLMLDYRPERPTRPTVEAVAQSTRDGYILTAFLPWRNLDLPVSTGDEVAVQCFVNRFEDNRLVVLSWHPETGTFQDSNRMRRVTLGPTPEAL